MSDVDPRELGQPEGVSFERVAAEHFRRNFSGQASHSAVESASSDPLIARHPLNVEGIPGTLNLEAIAHARVVRKNGGAAAKDFNPFVMELWKTAATNALFTDTVAWGARDTIPDSGLAQLDASRPLASNYNFRNYHVPTPGGKMGQIVQATYTIKEKKPLGVGVDRLHRFLIEEHSHDAYAHGAFFTPSVRPDGFDPMNGPLQSVVNSGHKPADLFEWIYMGYDARMENGGGLTAYPGSTLPAVEMVSLLYEAGAQKELCNLSPTHQTRLLRNACTMLNGLVQFKGAAPDDQLAFRAEQYMLAFFKIVAPADLDRLAKSGMDTQAAGYARGICECLEQLIPPRTVTVNHLADAMKQYRLVGQDFQPRLVAVEFGDDPVHLDERGLRNRDDNADLVVDALKDVFAESFRDGAGSVTMRGLQAMRAGVMLDHQGMHEMIHRITKVPCYKLADAHGQPVESPAQRGDIWDGGRSPAVVMRHYAEVIADHWAAFKVMAVEKPQHIPQHIAQRAQQMGVKGALKHDAEFQANLAGIIGEVAVALRPSQHR